MFDKIRADLGHARSHCLDVVMLADGAAPVFAVGAGFGRIEEQGFKGVGERIRVVGGAEEAAAGGGDDFRKGGVLRLDDRNACGHGLDDVKAEGFAVGGRSGKDGERVEESDFLAA